MQNNNFKINPQYLAGFFDGEGSMWVQIRYRASYALKFGIYMLYPFPKITSLLIDGLKPNLMTLVVRQLLEC